MRPGFRTIGQRFSLAATLFAGGVGLYPLTPAYSQDSNQLASAKLVSSDADFYYGAYRLREQWDRFLDGPVMKEFMEIPAFENAVAQFRSEWKEREGFGGQARVGLENGNVKEGLAFVEDLISTDVFITGDKSFSQWYETGSKLNEELQAILVNTDSSGDEDAAEKAAIVIAKMIEGVGKLNIPSVMMGGKCSNEDLALNKIDQLETAVFALGFSEQAAQFTKNLKRVEDARGNRLVWTFSGTQIPWDSIPTNESFDEEMRDSLREKLEQKSIVFTFGLLDGFFIVGISPSEEAILQSGKGQSILENSEMSTVRDAMDRPITSVSYVSDALSKAYFNSSLKDIFSRSISTNLVPLTQQLDPDSELRDFAKDVIADCKWLDDSIAKFVPEFKGSTSVSYLTDNGWERLDTNRTKDVMSDSSGPLLALEHVGGDPLLVISTKLQSHPEHFQLIRQIVQKFKARFDESVNLDWTEIGEDVDMDEAKENLDIAWPFLVRLADVWEKKFQPSMSGEHTLVVSGGNLSAKQWFKEMPESSESLPLPEVAMVTGVKKADLYKSGFEDLFAICDDVVELIRTKNPDSIPAGYKIPRPIESSTVEGVKFGYPIPEDCPVPKEMMPQILFNGSYAIGAYSDKQSASLAAVKKLEVGKGVIDANAKQSAVSYVDIGRMVDYMRPWVKYALIEALESLDDSVLDGVPEEYEGYKLTGKDLLALWGVLGKVGDFSSTSKTTPQGGMQMRTVYRSQSSK